MKLILILLYFAQVSIGAPPVTAVNRGGTGSTNGDPRALFNVGVAASVASNALTVSLKQSDATAPSNRNPIGVSFRGSNATIGSYVNRKITSALSIVVPSGATLGHPNTTAEYVYVYLLDNAGTVEMAVSTWIFDEADLQSTTAIDANSDYRHVLYSTTARTNVPVRLIGRLTSTQGTAGTWATAISNVALPPFQMPRNRLEFAASSYANATETNTTIVTTPYPIPVAAGKRITFTFGPNSGTNTGASYGCYRTANSTTTYFVNCNLLLHQSTDNFAVNLDTIKSPWGYIGVSSYNPSANNNKVEITMNGVWSTTILRSNASNNYYRVQGQPSAAGYGNVNMSLSGYSLLIEVDP